MKYIAIKVARTLKNDEYCIMGLKDTDYNWERMDGCSGTFDFIPSANETALIIAKTLSDIQKNYVPVYGLGGYGIGSFYKGMKYGKI